MTGQKEGSGMSRFPQARKRIEILGEESIDSMYVFAYFDTHLRF